jgi:antitoxin VapB
MNTPYQTRSFKSGNSMALRLPKGLGIGAGESFVIRRHGDTITARRVPTPAEEAERLGRFRQMLDSLKALPGPSGMQDREPIEFPERPGL